MGAIKQYRLFKDARQFAQSLKLISFMQWLDFCAGRIPDKGTRPPDIPSNPDQIYADQGWMGYGDWLGKGTIASFKRQFKPFAEAREYARSLKLESRKQWEAFCKGGLPIRRWFGI